MPVDDLTPFVLDEVPTLEGGYSERPRAFTASRDCFWSNQQRSGRPAEDARGQPHLFR